MSKAIDDVLWDESDFFNERNEKSQNNQKHDKV